MNSGQLQGRSQAWFKPPKQKYSPPKQNEAHLLFWAWAYAFCIFNIIPYLTSSKSPLQADVFFWARKFLAQTSAKISPPNPNPGYVPGQLRMTGSIIGWRNGPHGRF